MIDGDIPEVRPGFSCTADITTATRPNVTAVPIQAVAVRELVFDKNGQIVRRPRDPRSRQSAEPVAVAAELLPGQTRKEIEGVFVMRTGQAAFVPVKTGIAGEKFFEVLDGLKEGDEVITGPFASVRTIKEGDTVKISTAPAGATPGTPSGS